MLIRYRVRFASRVKAERRMSIDWLVAILTVVTAATPLVFAAVGETVVEKAGVLNLGVEGMMIMAP